MHNENKSAEFHEVWSPFIIFLEKCEIEEALIYVHNISLGNAGGTPFSAILCNVVCILFFLFLREGEGGLTLM